MYAVVRFPFSAGMNLRGRSNWGSRGRGVAVRVSGTTPALVGAELNWARAQESFGIAVELFFEATNCVNLLLLPRENTSKLISLEKLCREK